MTRLSSKNQLTVPVEELRKAGVEPGDELLVRAVGPGKLEVERVTDIIEKWAGSMTGVWPAGARERLHQEWER